MAKKDDLIAQAESMGIELDSNETVADLEAKITAKRIEQQGEGQDATEGELTRSKVNRGSRRRIERAITRLNEEIDAAIKEFDRQAFVADEDGNRTAEWPAVTRLREAKAEIKDQVNQLLAG